MPMDGSREGKSAFGQPVGAEVKGWNGPCPIPSGEALQGQQCRVERLDGQRHARSLWEAWKGNDPSDPDDGVGRWTYLGGRPFHDAAGCYRWAEQRAKQSDPVFVAIVDHHTGQALGTASWLNLEPEHGTIELGHISFSRALSRTRMASEALILMAAHAFALGYRRLEWKCDALNAPSRRAAERLGFTFEGIFRQHRIVAGRNRDTAWFSLLDHEWRLLEPLYREWLAADNFDQHGRQKRSLSAMTKAVVERGA
ncbi:GNAT family N-acetyltransferase [Halomonas denitrificans]|uniref:GNAT family N-acetyltransferase n=1 Tax=Halomonas TaxID=2745 RepID=UPI001CD4EFB8|nr:MULTISPECIES: GNAT family protein [Halomonas]MCA0973313.1 GNAT family N-acetyltransferase [Halomonas denitrificans]